MPTFPRPELSDGTLVLRALRPARQAGFRFEGVARRAGTTHSGVVDLHVFSRISDDLP